MYSEYGRLSRLKVQFAPCVMFRVLSTKTRHLNACWLGLLVRQPSASWLGNRVPDNQVLRCLLARHPVAKTGIGLRGRLARYAFGLSWLPHLFPNTYVKDLRTTIRERRRVLLWTYWSLQRMSFEFHYRWTWLAPSLPLLESTKGLGCILPRIDWLAGEFHPRRAIDVSRRQRRLARV